MADLAGHELQAPPRALVVEEDAARREEAVALAVVDRDPVAVDLGHAVGAAGVEGRGLGLGHLDDLAEHLAGAGLVEADGGVDEANGVQHPGHPQRRRLAGEYRLRPGRLHE